MAEASVELRTGIRLAYETFGDSADHALLLVMGLGGPMTWWHADLCAQLAARGLFVIRFDNRDVGHSSRCSAAGRLDRRSLVRAYLGDRKAAPYTLDDMAEDGFGLLDALGVERAHVAGTSMGGMIAQTMALARPERVQSLVSMMSSTGSRRVGRSDPRLLRLLLAPPARTREDYVRRAPVSWAVLGSPAYRQPDSEIRTRAGETWDRGVDRAGATRQMLAIICQADRTAGLRRLRMPACVVHGLDDRLVRPSGGRATARALPDAELVLLPGMGHDLPRSLWPVYVDAIVRTARRATAPAKASVSEATGGWIT